MKTWKSSLLWALYPFGILFFIFGLIAVVNWDYESKLLFLDNSASDWAGRHQGPILLLGALGLASIAGCLLFLIHILWLKAHTNWFLVPLTIITILLIFPGLFVIILGPAAITMIEQTRSVSR